MLNHDNYASDVVGFSVETVVLGDLGDDAGGLCRLEASRLSPRQSCVLELARANANRLGVQPGSPSRAELAPERRQRVRRDHNTRALSRGNRRFRDGLGWFSTGKSRPRN